jgi:multidrug efflux pump subunit AcrA (membrane-fusion protein)
VKLKVRKISFLIGIIIFITSIFFFVSCNREKHLDSSNQTEELSEKKILYYTCGMHPSVKVSLADYKKGKTNCPICNMNLVPVYKEKIAKESTNQRKILYYRNPMNPEITSAVPMKDSMGMDYIPVYEDEIVTSKTEGVVANIHLDREQIIRAEVKTMPVRLLHLFKEIRTVGRIAYDPKLAVAQEEFISAVQAYDKISKGNIKEVIARSEKLVEASRRKLRLLGMSEKQITQLQNSREIQRNLILPETKVWVYADIYEFELGWIKEGQTARVTTVAFPGEEFRGKIISINPTLDPKTRSVRLRLEIENPDMKLKPDMYVDVFIESNYVSAEGDSKVLAIPREAVLDTGLRKIVWVDLGGGQFQSREVEVGPEATTEIDGKIQRFLPILKGLEEGEMVVTRGNFLIDSQSQLTGAATAAYGGALEAEEDVNKTSLPGH